MLQVQPQQEKKRKQTKKKPPILLWTTNSPDPSGMKAWIIFQVKGAHKRWQREQLQTPAAATGPVTETTAVAATSISSSFCYKHICVYTRPLSTYLCFFSSLIPSLHQIYSLYQYFKHCQFYLTAFKEKSKHHSRFYLLFWCGGGSDTFSVVCMSVAACSVKL